MRGRHIIENLSEPEKKQNKSDTATSSKDGWFSNIGPGLAYVACCLGAGDMVSNAAAGAGYEYHLIWALGMTLAFRAPAY